MQMFETDKVFVSLYHAGLNIWQQYLDMDLE